MHVNTTIFRSKNDFKFGEFTVRQGAAWIEIWGKLKKTGKITCHAKITYGPGKGKSYQTKTEENNSEDENYPKWIPFEQL